jgi:hypothetical protein
MKDRLWDGEIKGWRNRWMNGYVINGMTEETDKRIEGRMKRLTDGCMKF